MKCPTCESENHETVRKPLIIGKMTLREHRCRECGERFASVQMAVTDVVASDIAAAVATEARRTTSSLRLLKAPAISATGGRD